MIEGTSPQRPWFKQFWPWFVVLLPTAGVIAGIATVVISINAAPTLTQDKIGRFAQPEAEVTDQGIEK